MAMMMSGDMLRVLLVSTQDETRDEVARALETGLGAHRLYWVSEPDLAMGRAEELVPQVVLVDDDLGGASATALIRDLGARAPDAVVLALVSADAVHRASQAVLAGARAFVTKPLRADELAANIREVMGGRRGPREGGERRAMGRVVALCAPKGGTGRTSLAINTAVNLRAITKQGVVLVDADYAAPALDVALNLHSERDVTDLLPRLSRLDDDLVSGVLAEHASGIKVLLAPPPADLSNPIPLPQVQQILVVLRRMFPWVVVDLGLPMDETAYAFLDGADRIVMSVLPEMVGLRNTRLMLDQMYERGYPESKMWLVVNRATLKGGISIRDIEERLRIPVAFQIPDDQPLATHAVNRGVPVAMSHRRSALGRALWGFAGRVAESFGATAAGAADGAVDEVGEARENAQEDLRARAGSRGRGLFKARGARGGTQAG
jgi:pilus assembly protein CpaE